MLIDGELTGRTWGRGTLKIINECRLGGLPDPQFSYDTPGLWLTFHGNIEETVEETVGETVGETILQLIRKNPKITAAALQQFTKLSRRGVEWNLEKLKKEEKLERIGSTKGGYWKVKI